MSQLWFKYAHIFHLKHLKSLNATQLADALALQHFRACTPHMPSAIGWYSPFDDPDLALVHPSQGCLLFALQLEDKILPASVIRDELVDKIKRIESEEQRKIHSKEKARLRDEVAVALLPKAFSKRQLIHAYIDPVLNLMVVNSVAQNKLTPLQKLFHQSRPDIKLNGLGLRALNFLMSEWILHPELLPDHLELGDACVLQNPDKEQSVVRCQRQGVLSEGVVTFLKAGFKVNQLRLTWREQLSFTLRADGAIQQIKFLEMLQGMREEIEVETRAEQIDADFFIMTQTFREFLQDFLPLICQANPFASRLSEPAEVKAESFAESF